MRKLMNPRQAGITAIPGSTSKPASTPLSLSTPGYAKTFDRDYVVRGRAERFDQSQDTEDAALGGLRAYTRQSPNSRAKKRIAKRRNGVPALRPRRGMIKSMRRHPASPAGRLRVSVAA